MSVDLNGLPPDLALQQQRIARNRKLADAMLQEAMTPGGGQMVSGIYVPEHWAQGLARMGKAWVAGRLNEDSDKQSADVMQNYNTGLSNAVQDYMTTRDGTPGQTMNVDQVRNLMENDVDPQLKDAVAPNPRQALVKALASGYAPLQQIATTELAAQSKAAAKPETFGNPVTEKDPASGKLVSVQYGNLGTRRVVDGATPFEKPMAVADRVVDPANPTAPIADFSKKGGEVKVIRGELFQQDSTGMWHKLDNSPKVQSTVINNGQKAGMQEWAKGAADTVKSLGDAARANVQLMGALQQMDKLSGAGTYSGVTAAPAQWLSSLAKTAGVRVDANTLANSEAYNSVATEAAQRLISQFGGNKGVTASEAEQIKQIVPQLQASPQARKQLTAILTAVAQRGIDDYKTASAAFNRAIKADDPTLFDFTPVMVPNDQPVTPQPAPSGAKKPTTSGW